MRKSNEFVMTLMLSLTLFSSLEALADVRGKVVDGSSTAIQEAVVTLFNSDDSTMVGTVMTDAAGDFLIRTGEGKFQLRVERIGFQPKVLEVDDNETLTVSLDPATTTLGEVVVTAYKPGTVRREAGKYVVVPKLLPGEAMIGLDVLKTLPLVEVSGDDKVLMAGKDNTIIYINGKLPIEPQDAVIASLRSMPPGNIKYVELITDPGAEYHNSSSLGIINVVVKNPNEGVVGSLYSYNTFADYEFLTHDNLWLGYQKGKLHLGAGITYSFHDIHNHSANEYDYTQLGYSTYNDTKDYLHGTQLFGNLSATYNLTPRSELAASLRMGGTANKSDIYTLTTDSRKDGADSFASKNHKPMDNPFVASALRYTLTTDPRGSDLELKATYSYQDTRNNTDYLYNGIYDATDLTRQKMEYLNAYAKYSYKPTFTGDFRFGYEYAYSKSDVANLISQASDRFVFRSNTHDMYASYSAQLVPWFYVDAGLRGEYYHSSGVQTVGNDNFRRNDWLVLPKVSVSFDLPKASQSISLGYSESGDLPWIDKMNPFRRWTSDNSYTVGNPFLSVTRWRNFDLDYSVLGKIFFSAYYGFHPKRSLDYTYFDEEGNTVTSTGDFGKSKHLSFELTYNDTYVDFIRLKATAGASYDNERGILNGESLSSHSWRWSARTFLTFIVRPLGTNIELWGFYRSGSKGLVQSHKSDYSVSLNLSKVFFKCLRAKLSVQSLLYKRFDRYNETPYYSYYTRNFRSQRSVNLTLTYVFGNLRAQGSYDESQNDMDSLIK